MVRHLFSYSTFRCETFAQPIGSAIPPARYENRKLLTIADSSRNVSLVSKNGAAALISALVNGRWQDVWQLARTCSHHRERTAASLYAIISGFFRVRRIRKPRLFFPRKIAPQICVNVLFHICGKGRRGTNQLFLIDLQHDFSKHWKRGSVTGFLCPPRAIVVESDAHRHSDSFGSVRGPYNEGIPVAI